jgi:hypothetical protein
LLQLVFASIIGRGFRFFLFDGLIRLYGEKVRKFIETRLEICLILGTIAGIGGIVALKFLRSARWAVFSLYSPEAARQ